MDEQRLRSERDAALEAARAALGDSTRLARLLAMLGEPGSIESLLDRTVSTLSELFNADVVVLFTPGDTGACGSLASVGLVDEMLHEQWSAAENTPLGEALRGPNVVLS